MTAGRGKFDSTRPCLVVAPHLEYPIRNGADILIDRKYAHFSEYVPFVDIVGRDAVVRYRNGKPVRSTPYENARVGKVAAATNTLRKRSHYQYEKFVTKEFVETARSYLARPDYGMVVFSCIWTAAIVRRTPTTDNRLHCIETHNDEFKWYENIRKSSKNPLAKLAAYSSGRWAQSFMEKYGSDFLFLHVSATDQKGFSERFPYHRSYVVPVGVDVPSDGLLRPEDPAISGKARLMFVGALGVKINLDALELFKRAFFPTLEKELREDLEVLVVGSNPSKRVEKLCEDTGWKLYPNVSDQELKRLYSTCTFSILPFSYTTGSKLKLLNSLAHGVPYLATSELRNQAEDAAYPCLVSSDPGEWSGRVRNVRETGITTEERALLISQAQRYSWESIVRRMFDLLTQGNDE